MIPDKPISFYHAGFVKFFNQGLKSSFPDSPFLLLSGGVVISVGHRFFFTEPLTVNHLADEHVVGSQIDGLLHLAFNKTEGFQQSGTAGFTGNIAQGFEFINIPAALIAEMFDQIMIVFTQNRDPKDA